MICVTRAGNRYVQAASTETGSRQPVAGLGDRATPDGRAARMLRWVQTKIGHQLTRTIKPLKVADLGDEHSGRDERDASQGLQRLDDRGQRPLRHQLADGLLQPFTQLLRAFDPLQHLFQGKMLSRMRKLQLAQPSAMHLRPMPIRREPSHDAAGS